MTVNSTPIEMVVGQSVDLLDGVAVDDDSSGAPQLHYQVIGRDNEPVSVDGRTIDPRTSGIPKGNYKLVITAADAVGNIGTSDRGLAVVPPTLPAPSISVKSILGTTVILSGLLDSAAAGWKISVDGVESRTVPNAAGQATIKGLKEETSYQIKAQALGDWVQPAPPEAPSGDWRDSPWSPTITVTIGSSGTQAGNLIEDRLLAVRARITAIREILADPAYLTDVTIDGISERINRQALGGELRDLERQEILLLRGSGSRWHNVDTSRA